MLARMWAHIALCGDACMAPACFKAALFSSVAKTLPACPALGSKTYTPEPVAVAEVAPKLLRNWLRSFWLHCWVIKRAFSGLMAQGYKKSRNCHCPATTPRLHAMTARTPARGIALPHSKCKVFTSDLHFAKCENHFHSCLIRMRLTF